MKVIEADIYNWKIECMPWDGARISLLQYKGTDLLTKSFQTFRPPEKNYGEYEIRPVFGYDDCFPTVDPCVYPSGFFECRDHGELCWNRWQARFTDNVLYCYTKCCKPKVTFRRSLEFTENAISWQFEVFNLSGDDLPFLHVMHALMPLTAIGDIGFPGFGSLVDESTGDDTGLKSPEEVRDFLLSLDRGSYRMLLLRNINRDYITVGFRNSLKLRIDFPSDLFPTLGVWWNNAGYPDEEGLRRNECAFEPIPGTCSNLSKSFTEGAYLKIQPGKSLKWEITWKIID